MRARRPDRAAVIVEALATRAVRGRHGFEDAALDAAARTLVREVAAGLSGPTRTGP